MFRYFCKGKGREGKGREGEGREGREGREGKGREGMEREKKGSTCFLECFRGLNPPSFNRERSTKLQ